MVSWCFKVYKCMSWNKQQERHLFRDSSMYRLEVVLFHKGNVLPSIPIASTIHKNKTYVNIKEVLSFVTYKTYQ
jgi:hypothetical protein